MAPHTAEALVDSDRQRGGPVQRWYVRNAGEVVGVATAALRPDDRLFVTFRVDDERAYGPLTAAIADEVGRPISTMCDDAATDQLDALRSAGFSIEMTGDRFVVPFDPVLRLVGRAWVPFRYSIRSVADVDEQRAFDLDNQIRNLVPGTDGWAGNADWFSEELSSAAMDPTAYLVAVDRKSDDLVGLIRIWRNPDGPRLGLIGVLPDHRGGPLAAVLLKQALTAASTWGHKEFNTETSPSNSKVHPKLLSMGLVPVGRFHQMKRV